MGLYGLKSLNEVFAGKIPGLPKIEDKPEVPQVDSVLKKTFSMARDPSVEAKIFGNFKRSSVDMGSILGRRTNYGMKALAPLATRKTSNFEYMVKSNMPLSRVNNLKWSNLPKNNKFFKDVWSRNATDTTTAGETTGANGNSVEYGETVIKTPSTKPVKSSKVEIVYPESVIDSSGATIEPTYKTTDKIVVDTGIPGDTLFQTASKKTANVISGAFGKAKEFAGEKYKEYQQKRTKEEERETKIKEAREQAKLEAIPQIEKAKMEARIEIEKARELAKLGIYPSSKGKWVGKGKNKEWVEGGFGLGGGSYTRGGPAPISTAEEYLKLRAMQPSDWQAINAALPGSPAGILQSVRGAVQIPGRPSSLASAAYIGGGRPETLKMAAGGFKSVSMPGNLEGADKIRWLTGSQAQKQEILERYQGQPQQVDLGTYEQPTQPTQRQSVNTPGNPPEPGMVWSESSKKWVRYTRAPYRK